MIALFSDVLWAWCDGEHVVVFGIRTHADGPDDALVVTAEGKMEYRALSDIQTEWRYDDKRGWVDDAPKGDDDDE